MNIMIKKQYRLRSITIVGLTLVFILGACSSQSTELPHLPNPTTEVAASSNQETNDPSEPASADTASSAEEQTIPDTPESSQEEQDSSNMVGENLLLLFPDMIPMKNLMPVNGLGERHALSGKASMGQPFIAS